MAEIIAAAVGVPLTFVLGWWGRGKWERYPWNAKPQRWTTAATSAEVLRAGPVGQFERQWAERAAIWAEALNPIVGLVQRAVEEDAAAPGSANADLRAVVEHFLGAYAEDSDDTVIEAIGSRVLTVGNVRDLLRDSGAAL